MKRILPLLLIIFFLMPYSVKANIRNNIEEQSEKIIYLTFDDGPDDKVTGKVLDILQEEKVPATFFVIGKQIKGRESLILRMKDEGHTIGLHSYSHDRNKLYSSVDGFLNEMDKVQKCLYDITGETYNTLRFPFGCNNMTYRLSTSMVNGIHDKNLKIYDWTQDSQDGANPTSPPSNIIKHSLTTNPNVTLLMHCGGVNKNSAAALPTIIKYYKDKGYTFKKITDDTPEIYKITRKV